MTPLLYQFQDFYDLAEYITAEYNEFIMRIEGYDLLIVEDVLEVIHTVFDPEELKFMLESDFGRGTVAGQIATLVAMKYGPPEEIDEELV